MEGFHIPQIARIDAEAMIKKLSEIRNSKSEIDSQPAFRSRELFETSDYFVIREVMKIFINLADRMEVVRLFRDHDFIGELVDIRHVLTTGHRSGNYYPRGFLTLAELDRRNDRGARGDAVIGNDHGAVEHRRQRLSIAKALNAVLNFTKLGFDYTPHGLCVDIQRKGSQVR